VLRIIIFDQPGERKMFFYSADVFRDSLPLRPVMKYPLSLFCSVQALMIPLTSRCDAYPIVPVEPGALAELFRGILVEPVSTVIRQYHLYHFRPPLFVNGCKKFLQNHANQEPPGGVVCCRFSRWVLTGF
jgi:hypothetical protein